MITILVVLEREGSRSESIRASLFFYRFLEVEILDREVVIAVFVRTANGCIIGFAQRVSDCVFFGEITSSSINTAVEEHGRVIGLGGVERWVAPVFLFEIGYKPFVGVIRQVDNPMLSSWYTERQFT